MISSCDEIYDKNLHIHMYHWNRSSPSAIVLGDKLGYHFWNLRRQTQKSNLTKPIIPVRQISTCVRLFGFQHFQLLWIRNLSKRVIGISPLEVRVFVGAQLFFPLNETSRMFDCIIVLIESRVLVTRVLRRASDDRMWTSAINKYKGRSSTRVQFLHTNRQFNIRTRLKCHGHTHNGQ